MTIDYDSLEAPTNEQLLKAVKHAIVQLLLGFESATIAGMNYKRVDLDKLRNIQKELENTINGTDNVTFNYAVFKNHK